VELEMVPAQVRETAQPVRGRDGQLLALAEQLDRVLSGVGTVVIVEGGAGMGKSRLIEEVITMARRLSIKVGTGLADPGDTIVQLSVLMEALFGGRSPLLDRAALPDAHSSPEQRYWLLQDVEALLERASLENPLLICLDDAQWADSGTAAALHLLPGRLAALPIAWIIALRPGQGLRPVRGALEFLERNGAEKLVLPPLNQSGVAQVAADILGAAPGTELLRMAERAGGSPYLLVELFSGLREEELIRVQGNRAELVAPRLPRRVSDSMRGRLDRMSAQGREAGQVAASLGRRFSLVDLAATVNVSPTALLRSVEELINSDLLVERDGKLAFSHDLTREAVRASLPVSVRRALDRQAATVLLAGGALPVEVATQLAASAEPGDEMAIATLYEAANALGASDPDAAADLSQRALELAPRTHHLRGPLVARTAVWLHAAGSVDEARAFADTALRQVLPAREESEVHISVASMFALSPDVRAEASRTALALPDLPPDVRARHLALLFHNLTNAGRIGDARAILGAATSASQSAQDNAGQFVLELAQSGLTYADGRFDRALELVESALRTGLNVSDETRYQLTLQWRCDVLMMLDRLDESLQMYTENIISAQHHRQGWALSVFETGRGRQLLQMGRLSDAAAAFEERFTVDTAHQVVSVLDAAGVGAMGRVAIHTGDRGLAQQAARIAQVMVEQSAPAVRRHGAWLLALQAMADGDAQRAHQWLGAFGEDQRTGILPVFPMQVADEAFMLHIALATQDHDLAASAAAAAEHRSLLNPDVRSVAAAAAHAQGLFNHSHEHLDEAVRLYDGGSRPLALALALEDLGALNVEVGQPTRGVDAFGRALELYALAGAAFDASRVRGRLRALGVRRRLVSTPRPGKGWNAMTDSELSVARLVAQGFTNREVAERLFVSHHTVSSHLRHVFDKLEINSRVELTRLAGVYDRRPARTA
jgi:DNA-binding CsgD family transcriptional regulator